VQQRGRMAKGRELSKLGELRTGRLEPVLNLLTAGGKKEHTRLTLDSRTQGAERSEPPRRLLP